MGSWRHKSADFHSGDLSLSLFSLCLVKFRHQHYLVRSRNGSWFGLKYTVYIIYNILYIIKLHFACFQGDYFTRDFTCTVVAQHHVFC